MSTFLRYYRGPPEGLEFVLSHESSEIYNLSDDQNSYPALATALRGYASQKCYSIPSQWDSVIRKLIRRGDDLHARLPPFKTSQCPFRRSHSDCSCAAQAYLTPLDKLFHRITDPFKAREAGSRWLSILSSEGCDVAAYLEKERDLHAAQSQMIVPYAKSARQLVFELGKSPCISWRWWHDPSDSAYLLFEEFTNWNLYGRFTNLRLSWPFCYQIWSVFPSSFESCRKEAERLQELAQRRADRRWWKRAARLDQLEGPNHVSPMPGCWPEAE